MKKAVFELPETIIRLSEDVKNEIDRLLLSDPSKLDKTDAYLYLIIRISALAEQSVKIIRNMLIGHNTANESIKSYFTRKNESEPISARKRSFDKINKEFNIKVKDFNWLSIAKRHQIAFFESKSDYEEFEKQFIKLRNQAAHEVMPIISSTDITIQKSFDFVLFLVDHYFNEFQKANRVLDGCTTISTDSLLSYNHLFMSNGILTGLGKIIFTTDKYKDFNYLNTNGVNLFTIDIREQLDSNEFAQIIGQYFTTNERIHGEIISRNTKVFKEMKERDKVGIEEAIKNKEVELLISHMIENPALLNYPIFITKEFVVFGKKKIESFL